MSEQFQNLSVDLDKLPKVEDIDFQPIHKDYLKVSLISNVITFVMLGGIMFTLFYITEALERVVYISSGSIWLFLFLLTLTMTVLGFKKKKYALRERDILYTKGLIWSVRTSIPFNRVQHAELKQGPIERKFKLSSLKVFTAGGQSSDLVIPGLPSEKAQELKDFVLGKTADDGEPSAV